MFHVGQFVVCVDDGPGAGGDPVVLRRGYVYTVLKVTPPRWNGCEWGVNVDAQGEDFTGYFPDYRADRFRPLRDESLSVFRQALEPAPKQTETA